MQSLLAPPSMPRRRTRRCPPKQRCIPEVQPMVAICLDCFFDVISWYVFLVCYYSSSCSNPTLLIFHSHSLKNSSPCCFNKVCRQQTRGPKYVRKGIWARGDYGLLGARLLGCTGCGCGCFLEWGYPQIIHLNRLFHSRPSIWG